MDIKDSINQELRKNAKNNGNKAAELQWLQSIANNQNHINIPEIYPISHNEVLNLFKQQGLDLEQRWQNIISAKPKKAPLSTYLKEQNKKSGMLSRLREDIVSCADKIKKSGYLSKKMTGQADDLYMVRSSSNEDASAEDVGDNLTGAIESNPGGNESFCCKKNFMESSFCKVLASYFSLKSIEQRATESKQDQSIKQLPQCSILIQHAIGEKPLSTKYQADSQNCNLVSGVVYTREEVGHTEGLFMITAAIGHGEGAVASKVPLDTYFVSTNSITKVIAHKPTRVAPVLDEKRYLNLLIWNNAWNTLKRET